MVGGHVAAAFAPQAVLGKIRGVPVILGALVSTPGSVVIHLYGARNEITDALDAKYESAFAAWASQAGSTGERNESPEQPGALLFSDVALVLSDDVGTPYHKHQTQSSGPGTQWEATWSFRPALPKEACSVTVAIDTDDPHAQACTLQRCTRGQLRPVTRSG